MTQFLLSVSTASQEPPNMILPKPQVQAILKGATEARFPADYEHPATEGAGEIAPVRTASHREPVCWVHITDWEFDDATDEYVILLRRVPAPDTPRMLRSRGPVMRTRRDDTAEASAEDLGYTDKPYLAVRGEPECVDEQTQARFAKEGWQGFNQRERHRLVDRRLLALEERLKLAWGDGQRLGVDLSDNLRAIDRIVGSMERKTDQSKDAA